MFKRLSWLAILAIGLCIAIPSFASDDEDSHHSSVRIKEAKWEAGDSRLVVKGRAPKRTAVTLKNADAMNTIAQAMSDREGKWRVKLSMGKPPCRVEAVANGSATAKTVENASRYCSADGGSTGGGSTGGGTAGGGNTGGTTPSGNYVAIASNDLGMHCADQDYRIFSILPPFNVVHSQVLKKGSEPQVMDATQVDVYYTAERSLSTAVPPDVITTTSQNIGGFKTNFWDSGLGRAAYDPLYPAGVLGQFSLPADTGLPSPNVERLHLGDGTLEAHQQQMPGTSNAPKPFHGYINNYPFFNSLPFGYVADNIDRFTAEGVPIMPVADPDSQGRLWESPYPLMKVTAVSKGLDPSDPANHLASVRIVLPIAAEADCQLCHLDQEVCAKSNLTAGQACNGEAASFASTDFTVISAADFPTVPGDTDYQKVLNASKINILRLHDAKHGTDLDSQRKVVCASCHYSTALDLAQLGPNDDNGKEQTQHISMSRAMHGFHGQFSTLFPDMPGPQGRDINLTQQILEKTCYACHPGKRTKCLRGAMAAAGVVCQDCHGNMKEVGDDFSAQLVNNAPGDPNWDANLDWSKRVPWASEPGCQSCHTGDATSNLAGDPNVIPASDGIRLLQAYRTNDPKASPIKAVNRRFAETRDANGKDHLYRLSKGHGGVMCEGCHGSTHAIWPTPFAGSNDNLAAKDLQGHTGVLRECSTCHGNTDLGVTLKGPHGMHPVASATWNKKHEDMAKRNSSECKSCHGTNGQGTELSRTGAERQWICKDSKGSLCSREGQVITVPKDTAVACTQCHENKINGD